MTDAVHTPGPWQQKHDWDIDGATTIIANADAEIDSEGTHYSYDTVAICRDQFDECLPEAEANARRIVACVNALEGISTAVIEAGVVRELVEALEFITNVARMIPGFSPMAIKQADAALAKIGGAS